MGNKGVGLILKAITVEYLLPLQHPDTITLAHSLVPNFGDGNEGNISSVNLRCMVLSHAHQRIAARALEDVPTYDYAQNKKVNLSPWLEKVFRQAKKDEDDSRIYWTKRREEIEKAVEALENASIKSGKAEDMGGNS